MHDARPPEALGPVRWAAARAIALLGLWLYLWLFVDTSLLHHSERRAVCFPAPPCMRTFACESLARPGGPVDYGAAWLSQIYYYPMLGAAIVTAVAGLLVLAAACYRVAGASSLLFALLCAVHEAVGRRWTAAGLALVLGAVTPLAGARVLGVPVGYAYSRLLFLDPWLDPPSRTLLIPLYLALPVLVLAVPPARWLASGRAGDKAMRGTLGTAAGLAALLGLWAAGLLPLDDPQGRTAMGTDRCLAAEDWAAIRTGEWEGVAEPVTGATPAAPPGPAPMPEPWSSAHQ
jgi:hypothetical protein